MSNWYEPEEDPFANGYDEQAMVDFWLANGVGTGLLPDTQPSGKQMTVANITGALGANRSALFDTAFQGGFGGAQAFAPDAFAPTITTTIRQEPELQQVYSYLRSPTSMEGIITQELMLGGTPATAQRALRQMLTATPEELTAIFTRYDQFFGREPSFNPAEAEQFKTNLLLELPPALDPLTEEVMVPAADGTGVDWNFSENGSVFARANMISELNAQIPRLGPSPAKWGTGPDGQPVQLSAGGELSWGVDESGAPVMIETTETPSEAAKVFTDLGLPTPADEYTMEDFVSPETNTAFGLLPQVDAPVQAAMAAMMDPSLAPTNTETMTPYKEGFAPVPLDWEPGSGGGGGSPNLTDTTGQVMVNSSVSGTPTPAAVDAPPAGSRQLLMQALSQGPERLEDFLRQHRGDFTPEELDAIGDQVTQLASSSDPGWSQTALDVKGLVGENIRDSGMGGSGWLTSILNSGNFQERPVVPPGEEVPELGGLIPPEEYGYATEQAGGPAGQSIGVTELMRRRAAGYAPAEQPPPLPGPDDYPAGDPATYEQFLAENMPRDVSGYNFIQSPDDLDVVRQILGQQPAAPRPDYGASATNMQQAQAAAEREAMLRQILPVAGPGPEQPRAATPGGTPPYVYGGSQAGPGPERPRGLGAGTTPPYVYSGGGAPREMTMAMLTSILGQQGQPGPERPRGLGAGTTPPYVYGGGGGPLPGGGNRYTSEAPLQPIETGERRAQQRQDQQNAQVLGGSTDRTGKRVRPTRTGEQARAFRAAMDQWHGALDQRNAVMQASWGSPEFGQGVAQEIQMRRAGVRPLDQAMMARRLVMMNAGVPQGI